MKIASIGLSALAGIFFLSGCISVKTQRPAAPTTVTRTTEQTTVRNPHSTTTETQTTQTY
jgi:PBP1b-binding outer membrane lipoprotein LpoB